MATVVATKAQETVREDAATQEGMKLLLDESWGWLFSGPCAGEEGLELLANDAVQQRSLRRSRCVCVLRVFVNRVGCRVCRGRPRALAGDRAGGSALRHCTRSDASRVPGPTVPTSAITSDRAFAFTRYRSEAFTRARVRGMDAASPWRSPATLVDPRIGALLARRPWRPAPGGSRRNGFHRTSKTRSK